VSIHLDTSQNTLQVNSTTYPMDADNIVIWNADLSIYKDNGVLHIEGAPKGSVN
jgi:hypothetical protein